MNRSFIYLEGDKEIGRYMGSSPYQAGLKALSKHGKVGKNKLIVIRETTNNSKKKIYKYNGIIKEVNNKCVINNKDVTFKKKPYLKMIKKEYENKIMKKIFLDFNKNDELIKENEELKKEIKELKKENEKLEEIKKLIENIKKL